MTHQKIGRIIEVYETNFSIIFVYDFGGMETLLDSESLSSLKEETILEMVITAMKLLQELERKNIFHLCLSFESLRFKFNKELNQIEDYRLIGWVGSPDSIRSFGPIRTIGYSPLEVFKPGETLSYSKMTVYSMAVILFEG